MTNVTAKSQKIMYKSSFVAVNSRQKFVLGTEIKYVVKKTKG